MDERSQIEFNKILAKDVNELTDTDKAFIRARSSYLGRRERRRYEGVLNEQTTNVEKTSQEVGNADTTFNHPGDADQTSNEQENDTEELVV